MISEDCVREDICLIAKNYFLVLALDGKEHLEKFDR
jgi:hypothetical protein